MPALPEVETIRRGLEPRIAGRTIETVHIHAGAEGLGSFMALGQLEERVGVVAGDGVIPHVQAPPESARSSI